MTQLGGHAHDLTPDKMQISHGETPKDTGKVLSRYGHGIAITPLHLAVAVAAIVNGGTLYNPSFLKLQKQPSGYIEQSPSTVHDIM